TVLITVVAIKVPLIRMVETERKLLPLTTRSKSSIPGRTLAGEIEAMTGFSVADVTVKLTSLLDWVLTVTLTGPLVAPGGTDVINCVGLARATTAGVPPNRTRLADGVAEKF